MMNATEREQVYLYISSALIVFGAGFGTWVIFGSLAAISAMFVAGGAIAYLRTIMTIKIAELEIHLKPVIEGNE